MSSRSFCDRCGKEIEGIVCEITIGARGKSYDLCIECKRELDEFMEKGLAQ